MATEASSVRPSFSLRTLLVVTLVICLGISHWYTSKRLSDARAEVRQLRDELGYVSIEDKTQFHAVALDTGEANTWRWRLYIPKGHRYSWNIASKDIPRATPPQRPGTMSVSNEPYWERDNEVLVTARLRQGDDQNWTLSVVSKIGDSKNQMSGASLTIPAEEIAWMSEVSSTDGQVLGDNGTAVRDPDGPIIFLQRRPCEKQPNGSYAPSEGPMPGFMVWLSGRK